MKKAIGNELPVVVTAIRRELRTCEDGIRDGSKTSDQNNDGWANFENHLNKPSLNYGVWEILFKLNKTRAYYINIEFNYYDSPEKFDVQPVGVTAAVRFDHFHLRRTTVLLTAYRYQILLALATGQPMVFGYFVL